MYLHSCILCLVLQLLLLQDVIGDGSVSEKGFKILFVNDLNYGFFPVNENYGDECKNASDSTCVAGLARLANQLQDVNDGKSLESNTIWLNAGNFLGQNNEWFDLMQFKPAIDSLNSLDFSAVAVGSEVFQYGREKASNFIESLKGVAFAINVNTTDEKEPPFQNLLTKSKTFQLAGFSVTVIGFLDKEGMREKDMTGLTIYKELYAIENFMSTTNSTNDRNKIVIAIGSVKTLADAQRLAEIKGLDIVIFSGGNIPEGKYSNNTYVEHISGSNCWLISTSPPKANEFHHILGDLSVTASEGNGKVNVNLKIHDYGNTNQSGNSIILNIEKDGLKRLNSIKYDYLATSKLPLIANDSCMKEECVLGNLVTDAMMSMCIDVKNILVSVAIWTPAPPHNSTEIKANMNFTEEDIHKILGIPDEGIYTVTVSLGTFIAYLENFLASSKTEEGKFLHLSGMYVEYNNASENGKKITAIRVVGSDMKLQYLNLTSQVNITVALPSRMLFYEYDLGRFSTAEDRGVTVATALVEYIRRPCSGVNILDLPTLGLRYRASDDVPGPIVQCVKNTSEVVLLTLAVVVLVIAAALVFWRVIIHRMRRRRGSLTQLIY